jgi:hypothetical protein
MIPFFFHWIVTADKEFTEHFMITSVYCNAVSLGTSMLTIGLTGIRDMMKSKGFKNLRTTQTYNPKPLQEM